MSEPKWAPGPWDFMWIAAPASGGGHLYITDHTGRKIAAIWGKAEEKEFAARLIAAAPELYEALNALLASYGDTTPGWPDRFKARTSARRALAKARGD